MTSRVSIVLAAAGVMTSQGTVAAQSCTELSKPGLFPHTVVQSAAVVAADARTGLPAYCEVKALISPVPGSKITAVYRLPENWNGRMLGLGGGGWAGNLYLPAVPSGPGQDGKPRPAARLCNGADRWWSSDDRSGRHLLDSRQPGGGRRFQLPRHARDDDAGQTSHRQSLRSRTDQELLPGMLHWRPHGHDGDAALSG